MAARVTFVESDLFANVIGAFDLIVFDPPFRWFRPRTLLERAVADENYETLTRFMSELPSRLTSRGRSLVSFGTSGDMAYLTHLIDLSGLTSTTLRTRDLVKDGVEVTYVALKLSFT